MSSRSCCLKLKECSRTFDGKADAMLFLVEEYVKKNVPMPPKAEPKIIEMFEQLFKQADEINALMKTDLGI